MSETFQVIPKHVGFVLDGNRRWAKAKGLPTLEGHRRGADRFKEITLQTFGLGVEYVSAYIFSAENWSRTEEEVSYLMNLVLKVVETELDEFHNQGIKIVALGVREGLSDKVLKAIENTTAKTKNNTNGTLALCFNYGGKQEIVDAANAALAKNEALTVESISKNLYHPEIPGVDLLIRTSGEYRTSGFMLWRSDYAELYFTDVLWPDFQTADLDVALEWYKTRDRRFGK